MARSQPTSARPNDTNKTKRRRLTEPRCRICACTQSRACPAGCGWAQGEGDLCTVCAAFRDELAAYFENCAGVSNASLLRLWREAQEKLGLA